MVWNMKFNEAEVLLQPHIEQHADPWYLSAHAEVSTARVSVHRLTNMDADPVLPLHVQ